MQRRLHARLRVDIHAVLRLLAGFLSLDERRPGVWRGLLLAW